MSKRGRDDDDACHGQDPYAFQGQHPSHAFQEYAFQEHDPYALRPPHPYDLQQELQQHQQRQQLAQYAPNRTCTQLELVTAPSLEEQRLL